MKRFAPIRKATRWLLWATALVVTSSNSAQAMGIVAPSAQDTWKDVRRELSRDGLPEGISEAMSELLGRLETGSDYRLILRLSYSIAKPDEMEALDDFWTRFMATRGEDSGFVTMLEIRSRVLGEQKLNRRGYLESWLYLARHGGNYDCGGGGGGNCGNGLGNGGGNGSGSEGGHHGHNG